MTTIDEHPAVRERDDAADEIGGAAIAGRLRGESMGAGVVVSVRDMGGDGGGPWRLFIGAVGVAQWPSPGAEDGGPREYAEEVARCVRMALERSVADAGGLDVEAIRARCEAFAGLETEGVFADAFVQFCRTDIPALLAALSERMRERDAALLRADAAEATATRLQAHLAMWQAKARRLEAMVDDTACAPESPKKEADGALVRTADGIVAAIDALSDGPIAPDPLHLQRPEQSPFAACGDVDPERYTPDRAAFTASAARCPDCYRALFPDTVGT